jgi:hypothetical protein
MIIKIEKKERKRVGLGYLISGYRNEVGGGRR